MQETSPQTAPEAPRSRSYYLQNTVFYGLVLLLSVALPQPRTGAGTVVFGWQLPACCPSKAGLGINCPGCGLTRAFVCTADGDLSQAVRYNRLGPAMFVFVVCIFAVNLGRLLGLALVLPPRLGDRIAAGLIVLLIANWGLNLCVGGWTWLRGPL